MLMAAPNYELENKKLRFLRSDVAEDWAEIPHVLKGFYELADMLIVLDEVLCL